MFHFKLKFGKDVPHILFDGIIDDTLSKNKKDVLSAANICIENNINKSFANLDAANGFKNIDYDLSQYSCSLPSLSPLNK